jgi:outer membrane murein-binding lipoprotein Lpp
MTVEVMLLNPGRENVTVGAGITEIVAVAGRATAATLQEVSADAQGLLVAGVVIAPAEVDPDQLAAFVADWAAEHAELEPSPQTAPPENAADDDIAPPPTASDSE